jgi:hypothetical protein
MTACQNTITFICTVLILTHTTLFSEGFVIPPYHYYGYMGGNYFPCNWGYSYCSYTPEYYYSNGCGCDYNVGNCDPCANGLQTFPHWPSASYPGVPNVPVLQPGSGLTSFPGLSSASGLTGVSGMASVPGLPSVSLLGSVYGSPNDPRLAGVYGSPDIPVYAGVPGSPNDDRLTSFPGLPSVTASPGVTSYIPVVDSTTTETAPVEENGYNNWEKIDDGNGNDEDEEEEENGEKGGGGEEEENHENEEDDEDNNGNGKEEEEDDDEEEEDQYDNY